MTQRSVNSVRYDEFSALRLGVNELQVSMAKVSATQDGLVSKIDTFIHAALDPETGYIPRSEGTIIAKLAEAEVAALRRAHDTFADASSKDRDKLWIAHVALSARLWTSLFVFAAAFVSYVVAHLVGKIP